MQRQQRGELLVVTTTDITATIALILMSWMHGTPDTQATKQAKAPSHEMTQMFQRRMLTLDAPALGICWWKHPWRLAGRTERNSPPN